VRRGDIYGIPFIEKASEQARAQSKSIKKETTRSLASKGKGVTESLAREEASDT
jgi:hypothetical protein